MYARFKFSIYHVGSGFTSIIVHKILREYYDVERSKIEKKCNSTVGQKWK